MRIGTKTLYLAALLAAAVSLAGTPVGKRVPLVNVDRSGVALHGYDPISYFEAATPVAGDPEITFAWRGATWRFASTEHRDAFARSPVAFAPQYGGYCAKAVSENHTADTDPFAYKVVDGKLYLNFDAKVQKLWEQDIPGRIAHADGFWPGLQLPD
jgi:hypothetical protein